MEENFKQQTTSEGALEGHTDWTRHAPPGGITIAGKTYGGGRFIPNEELEKASPEEIAELNRKTELSQMALPSEKAPGKSRLITYDDLGINNEGPQTSSSSDIVKELIYIIDDGKILGGDFGELVIKKSITQDIFLDEKEVAILNSLKTKRLDIIAGDATEVYSIYSNGLWPTENTIEMLGHTKQTIPISEYSMLNNLSHSLRECLISPAIPPVTRLSLYRLSKKSDKKWNVETSEGKKAVLRTAGEKEKRTIKFIYNIYKAFEVPVELLKEVEEGFLTPSVSKEIEDKDKDKDKDKDNKDDTHEVCVSGEKDVIDGQVLDKVLGIKPKFALEKDRIIRKDLETDLDSLTEDEVLDISEDSPVYKKLTPDLIDTILSELNFPPEEFKPIKNKIIKRLESSAQANLANSLKRVGSVE